jgi:hypothetical protein
MTSSAGMQGNVRRCETMMPQSDSKPVNLSCVTDTVTVCGRWVGVGGTLGYEGRNGTTGYRTEGQLIAYPDSCLCVVSFASQGALRCTARYSGSSLPTGAVCAHQSSSPPQHSVPVVPSITIVRCTGGFVQVICKANWQSCIEGETIVPKCEYECISRLSSATIHRADDGTRSAESSSTAQQSPVQCSTVQCSASQQNA